MTDSIATQMAALPKKPTPELKQMWRELFGERAAGVQPQLPNQPARVQDPGVSLRRAQARDPAKLDALADALNPKAARKRVVNGPVVGTQLAGVAVGGLEAPVSLSHAAGITGTTAC